MPKKLKLRYDPDYYYAEAVESGVITEAEARAEYARLRKTAETRLSRLAESRFSEWNIYTYNKDRFLPPSQISDANIGKALEDVARFLRSKASTPAGAAKIEAKQLKTLEKSGIDFVNEDNISQFGEFMKKARSFYTSRLFDSERAVSLFKAARDKGIDPETLGKTKKTFKRWMQDVEELEQTPKHTGSRSSSALSYRREINKRRRGE